MSSETNVTSEKNSTVHVGTLAEVKVGRHQVLVVVIASTSFGWMVKSISSGREFQVAKIEKVFPSDDNEATDKSEATDYETTNSEQDSPIMENPAQNSETTTPEPERTTPDMEAEKTITEPAEVVEQETASPEPTTSTTESAEAAEQTTTTTESAAVTEPTPEPTEATVPTPTSRPTKKMSLMDAAVEVLKVSGQPMNTREMVKEATDQGLWIPTGCKTPEQTLYGSIFREIASKDSPRIVKAEQKGKFRLG